MGKGSSTDQATLLNKGQRNSLNNLTSFVNPQIGQGGEVFGGERVAGLSPLQQGAIDIFGQQSGNIGDAISGGLEGLGASNQALQDFLGNFDSSASDARFNAGVAAPSLLNFQQTVIPQLAERFSNVAGSSGVLAQAFGDAGNSLSTNLASQKALFTQGAENNFNQNKLQASGQLANQSQGGLSFLNTLSNLGGQQRDVNQQGLGADFARFSEGQAVNNPILQLLPLILGTRPFENIVQGGGGGLGSALGNIGGAFAGSEAGSNKIAGIGK